MPPENTVVDFETFRAYRDRDDRGDWSVDSLRREWGKRMRGMLRNENMVEAVFGQIPINATARRLDKTRWYVDVAPDSTRQASYATPTFDVRTVFHDPRAGEDSVTVRLAPCNYTAHFRAYNCGTSQIVFGSREIASGGKLDSVLNQASLDSVSKVHLVTYTAGQSAVGAGGGTWH
jgi:hypothetical protein